MSISAVVVGQLTSVAGSWRWSDQSAVELAGDVPLEAAADLLGGLALGGASGDVGLGGRAAGMRAVAMVCSARFRARSPPRLRRYRMVRPLLAGSGLAPPRAAIAASLRHRPGCENDTMAWAALTGPMPRRSINPGTRSSTMVCSWTRLVLSSRVAARRARARRRISACRTACSRLASRGGRRRARPARRCRRCSAARTLRLPPLRNAASLRRCLGGSGRPTPSPAAAGVRRGPQHRVSTAFAATRRPGRRTHPRGEPVRVCAPTRCTASTAAQRTSREPCLSVAPETSSP